jgi:L-threonylcarbamoyladenylate synthase
MLAAHYSPAATVLLAESAGHAAELHEAHPGAVAIGVDVDVVDYARHLYEWLRSADDAGARVVVAVLPAPNGLGHAVRDRLVKAAGGRAG